MEVKRGCDQEAGGKCQWMLHQNAANGPEYAVATPYERELRPKR